MKHIALNTLVAATVCLTAPAMAKTQQLTESMVREMVNKTEALVKNHNIDEFAKYLSDDLKVYANVNMNGQQTDIEATKPEYIAQLKQGMGLSSDYTYNVNVNGIKVDGDTAYVQSTVKESMTITGVKMESTALEKSTVKLIDGKLKVTELKGDITISVNQ